MKMTSEGESKEKLNITIFGGIKVEKNGEKIRLSPQKQALLLYLVFNIDQIRTNGKELSRKAIFDWIYPTPKNRQTLTVLLSEFKNLLGKDWFFMEGDEESELFDVDHPGLFIDLIRYQTLYSEIAHGGLRTDELIGKCIEACLLYEKGPLQFPHYKLANDSLFSEMDEKLARQQAEILKILINCFQEQGDVAKAIVYGEKWSALDKFNEEAHKKLFELYVAAQEILRANEFRRKIYEMFKKEGLEPTQEIVYFFEETLQSGKAPSRISTPNIPLLAPHEPEPPPEIEGFIGREQDIILLTNLLDKRYPVCITGMSGIGKTMLAASVARKISDPNKIFWFTFHENVDINGLLWELANFLAWHGNPEVWEAIQHGLQKRMFDTSILMDTILQQIAEKNFLLCLDDIHFVENAPSFNKFFQRLVRMLHDSEMKLIVISKLDSAFNNLFRPPYRYEVKGLRLEELQRMVESYKFPDNLFTNEFIIKLHKKTGGNAQLLTFALIALSGINNLEQFLQSLHEEKNIAKFLITAVDQELYEHERAVLKLLAVYDEYPISQVVIREFLPEIEVQNALYQLQNRNLLAVQNSGAGKFFTLHHLIGQFYYDGMSRNEQKRANQQAGDYFYQEKNDNFLAAKYYAKAKLLDEAARMATRNIEMMLNMGYARELQHLLERLLKEKLAVTNLVRLLIALGYLCTRQGKNDEAKTCFQKALHLLAIQPDSPEIKALFAEACFRLAETLQRDEHQEALEFIEKALAIRDVELDLLPVHLLLLKAEILTFSEGDHQAALDAVHFSLALLPENATALQIKAFITLSAIVGNMGNSLQAIAHLEKALSKSREVQDKFSTISILNNLSVENFLLGHWDEAFDYNAEGSELARTLGSILQRLDLDNNLGWMLTQKGEFAMAERTLKSALALAQERSQNEPQLYIHTNMGCLALRQQNWDNAELHLKTAEDLSTKLENDSQYPEIARGFALLSLYREHIRDAYTHIQHSIEEAQKYGDSRQEGLSTRVLGQIQAKEGRLIIAEESFERSWALLNSDPYESAHTRAQWGHLLLVQGDEKGLLLLQQAKSTFHHLGAMYDAYSLDNF